MSRIPELKSEEIGRLIRAATDSRDQAYAPHSHFYVGAALLMPDGQIIAVGRGVELVLKAQATGRASTTTRAAATLAAPETRTATVLVGDIRNFTVLVRTTPSEALQRSVTRVFARQGAESS